VGASYLRGARRVLVLVLLVLVLGLQLVIWRFKAGMVDCSAWQRWHRSG